MVPAVRPSPPPHPAEFPRPILSAIASALLQYQSGPVVLDPFAGTGGIHHLHRLTPGRYSTVGVEIEPEWVFVMRRREISDDRPRSSQEVA